MTFLEEFKKPFNIFTIFFAIAIGYWFYYISLEASEPYYTVSDSIKIFDKSNSANSIKVINKQGNIVEDSVYAIEVTLWNAGKRPIEQEDVRIPLSIHLQHAFKIIDAEVVQEIEPEVSVFRIVQNVKKPNSLDFSFKHLDPNLGAKIKIVYTGVEDPGIKFNGRILGAEFKNGASPIEQLPQYTIFFVVISIVIIIVFVFEFADKTLYSKDINSRNRHLFRFAIRVILWFITYKIITFLLSAQIQPL
jgi:hypothetical protein